MKKRILSIVLALALIISAFSVSAVNSSAATEFTDTSYNFTKKMTAGVNIGNTLDSTPGGNETGWGNPMITEDLVKALKAKGFDTIRLPVTWGYTLGNGNLGLGVLKEDGSFNDGGRWLNRVKTVTDWIINNGLFCIVNTHHQMGWLKTWYNKGDGDLDEAKVQTMLNANKVLWTNIANKFKDYGEKLVFEAYNETRAGEDDWSSKAGDNDVLQRIGQSFIDAVRATGSNNTKRYVLLNTYAASMNSSEISKYKIPTDPANHIIIGVHSYDPKEFCFREYSTSTFNQTNFESAFKKPLEKLTSLFLSKGIGVIMGECGAVYKNNESEILKYVDALCKKCYSVGIVPVWWENGVAASSSSDAFGLINRNTYAWTHEAIANKFVNCCKTYGANRPSYEVDPTQSQTVPTQSQTDPTPTQPQPTSGGYTPGKVFNAYSAYWWSKLDGWGAGMKGCGELQGYLEVGNDLNLNMPKSEGFWGQMFQIAYLYDRGQKNALVQAMTNTKKLMYNVTLNSAVDNKGNTIDIGLSYQIATLKNDTDDEESITRIKVGQTVTMLLDISSITTSQVSEVAESPVIFILKNKDDWNAGVAGIDITFTPIYAALGGGDTPTQTQTQTKTPTQPQTTTQAKTTQHTVPTQTVTPSTRKVGDVNNDSVVNVNDVNALLSMTTKGNLPAKGTDDFKACDVDNNGVININDVQALLNKVLKS